MNPVCSFFMRVIVTAAVIALSACVYKIDIQQGNEITSEMVSQLEVGMSKREVTRILGLPLITDPFNKDRWDYYYSLRDGKSGETIQHLASLRFEGDSLVKIHSSFDKPTPEAAPASE